MYLNTRDPSSIVKRLRTIEEALGGIQWTTRPWKREHMLMEQAALRTILSRWCLIFPVGDDPPQLY
tara:strand:+ start:1459 stop:1656 length:198 start_codon:yes stop_codon:yes gene_type:complete